MSYDPDTRQYRSYKVGDRVWIKTDVNGPYTIRGTVVKVEPPSKYHASLEMYTIKLDRDFTCPKRRQKSRTHNLGRWITDSSMCEALPVLEDLSGI